MVRSATFRVNMEAVLLEGEQPDFLLLPGDVDLLRRPRCIADLGQPGSTSGSGACLPLQLGGPALGSVE